MKFTKLQFLSTLMIGMMAVSMVGCKSMFVDENGNFSPAKAAIVAKMAGQTSAQMALTRKEFTPKIKEGTVMALSVITAVAPDSGEQFYVKAFPFIDTTVAQMVADGKIKPEDQFLVAQSAKLIVAGVDSVGAFYPKWTENKDNVLVVVKAFSEGALEVLKNSNTVISIDKEVKKEVEKAIDCQGDNCKPVDPSCPDNNCSLLQKKNAKK